jgi:hypothetical protein
MGASAQTLLRQNGHSQRCAILQPCVTYKGTTLMVFCINMFFLRCARHCCAASALEICTSPVTRADLGMFVVVKPSFQLQPRDAVRC